MTDYYQVLGIKQSATTTEIKSAYRKLARKRHPDVNRGSEKSAREFALLSLAYHTLIDPQERAFHDQQLIKQRNGTSSILHSDNPHAQRARAAQARWDRVVNQILEHDRHENLVRQRAVFTTVSLFLSTFFVAMIKPPLWQSFGLAGRGILLTLFALGVWHLIKRLREYFQHYTYKPDAIHYSITQEDDSPQRPFTRFSAYAFLVGGYAISLGVGLLIGWQAEDFFSDLTLLFRHHVPASGSTGFSPTALMISDLFFYPPIAVLIIDTLHGIASRIDTGS
ncbi:MAG TPA: DnaJ domain-containing protein [Pyrinomonadaceae bacterium]|nr:DnaJ domain-containing protein [Pyrinomonadaceae bacterium]